MYIMHCLEPRGLIKGSRLFNMHSFFCVLTTWVHSIAQLYKHLKFPFSWAWLNLMHSRSNPAVPMSVCVCVYSVIMVIITFSLSFCLFPVARLKRTELILAHGAITIKSPMLNDIVVPFLGFLFSRIFVINNHIQGQKGQKRANSAMQINQKKTLWLVGARVGVGYLCNQNFQLTNLKTSSCDVCALVA